MGQAMTDTPATASFAEFARLMRWKRNYVTQLRKDDRLVLTEGGKAVRVAESVARIAATADPAKAAVAARHAAAREAAAAEVAADEEVMAANAAAEATPAPTVEGDDGFQYWRRRSERAKALAAERENRKSEGELLDAVDVSRAISALLSTLRTSLETLPEVLAPQLAAMDEAAIRKLIAEEVETHLDEAARGLTALGKTVGT